MIAGLDLSSLAIDLVLLDDDNEQAGHERYTLTGGTPADRARHARTVFPGRSFFEDHGVWLVGMEDPMSAFPHVAKAIGMVTGAVLALLPPGLPVVMTPPHEWKRLFTGHADATKLKVANRAAELGFPEDLGQDACDAFGVAFAVRALNEAALRRTA